MKKISFEDPHRRLHFDFFRNMDSPHFGITADVDITIFLDCVRRSPGLRFTPAIVYLITQTALEISPFCWRIRGEEVVAHDNLKPSFTVPTAASSVFSFCTVPYLQDPTDFHTLAEETIEAMKENPSFEDEPGADDYLFLSAFPWASFTSITHAMNHSPADSIPRITWGKYYKRDQKVFLPLGVQAHHALVDGSDIGRYYQLLEQKLKDSENIFDKFL
ncbi:CatA-like O-acetyltransferase [Neolewinella agarilytica]|uniref:Chloramphenicol O-acetyltransferase type A n=1 Tax=Neolewinella agarilytica TaxID=478744 RepID=A0A1H9HP66_9BACT|nr:CatA-like O-acetyltransferase [Neolewinella agarilytica]SEQ64131.1 chloramphenicol O-acetyltransferase type A [Neolewinella agarilytica]